LPDVALYGDSLTVPAEPEITTGADGIAALTIHAYPGTDLPTWDSNIRASSPSRLVLALGTNDVNHRGIAPWRDLLTFLPSSTCVVWPRTFESSDRVTAFVGSMDELAAEFPNVHVVEWGAQVEVHREWLLPDGIHYGRDGTSAYASMLVEAIQTCLS
jgi:lysophospholipase L1-like esterase